MFPSVLERLCQPEEIINFGMRKLSWTGMRIFQISQQNLWLNSNQERDWTMRLAWPCCLQSRRGTGLFTPRSESTRPGVLRLLCWRPGPWTTVLRDGTLENKLDYGGSDFIRGLINLWVHNHMHYCRVEIQKVGFYSLVSGCHEINSLSKILCFTSCPRKWRWTTQKLWTKTKFPSFKLCLGCFV